MFIQTKTIERSTRACMHAYTFVYSTGVMLSLIPWLNGEKYSLVLIVSGCGYTHVLFPVSPEIRVQGILLTYRFRLSCWSKKPLFSWQNSEERDVFVWFQTLCSPYRQGCCPSKCASFVSGSLLERKSCLKSVRICLAVLLTRWKQLCIILNWHDTDHIGLKHSTSFLNRSSGNAQIQSILDLVGDRVGTRLYACFV